MRPAAAVAAIYVETGGEYFGLPFVDPWDILRDARQYSGPWPVVAHPPCNKWSTLANSVAARVPGFVIGDDGGCFEHALWCVRTFGGVLEHPAKTRAWSHFGLPKPVKGSWQPVGDSGKEWTTEVDQGSYGHEARKSTWLFYAGTTPPPDLNWTKAVNLGTSVGGGGSKSKHKYAGRRLTSDQASRTPVMFRDILIRMAAYSNINGDS